MNIAVRHSSGFACRPRPSGRRGGADLSIGSQRLAREGSPVLRGHRPPPPVCHSGASTSTPAVYSRQGLLAAVTRSVNAPPRPFSPFFVIAIHKYSLRTSFLSRYSPFRLSKIARSLLFAFHYLLTLATEGAQARKHFLHICRCSMLMSPF